MKLAKAFGQGFTEGLGFVRPPVSGNGVGQNEPEGVEVVRTPGAMEFLHAEQAGSHAFILEKAFHLAGHLEVELQELLDAIGGDRTVCLAHEVVSKRAVDQDDEEGRHAQTQHESDGRRRWRDENFFRQLFSF